MTRKEMLKRLKAGENPLEISIQKWQDIVDGKGGDAQGSNCALCEIQSYGGCKGCIIYIKTKRTQCRGTPYYSRTPKEMLEFLKSLRKMEEI